jgi:hypothetical protein
VDAQPRPPQHDDQRQQAACRGALRRAVIRAIYLAMVDASGRTPRADSARSTAGARYEDPPDGMATIRTAASVGKRGSPYASPRSFGACRPGASRYRCARAEAP